MVNLIIPAIILIGVMFLLAFFIFKNIVKSYNSNVKMSFVEKLNDYDYIIEDKKKEIERLNKEVEKLNRIKEENRFKQSTEDDFSILEKKLHGQLNKVNKEKNVSKEGLLNYIKLPEYKEDTFFYNYKRLRSDFNFDNEQVIKKFIKEHKDDSTLEEYNLLSEFIKQFNNETMYNLLTLTGKQQLSVINEIIPENLLSYLKVDKLFINEGSFNVKDFTEYINKRIEQIDPIFYVYVSNSDKSYDYLDENIKTLNYNNMSEGVIIKYKGKIYDYSI